MSLRSWRVLHTRQQSTVPNGSYSNDAYGVVLEHRSKNEVLLFQRGVITELSPTEFELIRPKFSILLDCYGCLGVYESPSKNNPNDYFLHLVLVTGCCPVGKLPAFEVFQVSAVAFVCLNFEATDIDVVSDVRKLLSAGTFFFARDISTGMPFDLTLSIQNYYLSANNSEVVRSWGKSDFRFLWNKGLMAAFSRVGICPTKWLTPIICGQFDVKTVYSGNNQSRLGLVSRISTQHPGTRFNARGVNDDGDVANFVETEQFVYWNNQVASHVQLRGTVPLFWEQPGIQMGSHKIKLSRLPNTSLQAFQRHFSDILSRYGETVIVNLMGSKEGEAHLSAAYKEHLEMSDYANSIAYHHFDYHANVSSQNFENLQCFLAKMSPKLHAWDFFHIDGSEVKRVQKGVVRVNCVDCLDRTNMFQSAIALTIMLPHILVSVGLLSSSTEHLLRRFTETARDSWQKNGDNVSRMYTGTGALGKDRSKLRNVQRSAARTIQNNFLDGAKQEAMHSLLTQTSMHGWMRLLAAQFLPQRLLYLPPSLLRDALARYPEYAHKQPLKIFVGTYNVNGKKDRYNLDPQYGNLSDWLTNIADQRGFKNPNASPEAFERPVDVFAIGFQEIVDLNASNIVAVRQSSDSQQFWASVITKIINRDSRIEEPYVLISTVQLVGLCVFVFIRESLCELVRGLSVGSIKTGLHGTAGNKGAVAVRFELGSTSLCFCCCHFSAGQSAVRERTSEYYDISSRLILPGKRRVASHDHVFWFGDMNYRIDLPIDEVKSLLRQDRLLDLLRSDQLSEQRRSARLFEGYTEALLLFPPTYKYTLLQDEYDSASDKPRVPSWTDRIFWRSANLDFGRTDSNAAPLPAARSEPGISTAVSTSLLAYCRAEIKISDHRPVGALFDIHLLLVDRAKRRRVLEEVILANGPADATVRIRWTSENDVEVTGNDIYASVVEIAMSSGTILVPRFRSYDELLLTFSSPSEAVEAVRCLHGNKVSTEVGSNREVVNVTLSVCLDSAPSLRVRHPAPITFQEQLNVSAGDPSTRDWLTEMNNIVNISEDQYTRTHGPDPASSVFKPAPRKSPPNQEPATRIMSEYERFLFDSPFPYSEPVVLPAAKIHPSHSFTAGSSAHMHAPKDSTLNLNRSVNPPPVPRQDNFLTANAPAVFPGLDSLTELLPPPSAPLHPVASCGDLSADDSISSSPTPGRHQLTTQFEVSLHRNHSAMVSPVHATLKVDAPPRPPPPKVESTPSDLGSEPLVAFDHPAPQAPPPPQLIAPLLTTTTPGDLPPPLVPQRVGPPPPPRRPPVQSRQ
ncbi:Synaptojanin-1 [Sparganum proliferum]